MIATLIQAHPLRVDLAEGLRACLGGRAEIVLDPEPDDERKSPWRTYRACLEAGLAAGPSHILVLQEDVIVCGRFLAGVELAVAAQPDRPLLFFVPGKPPSYMARIDWARAEGRSWAEFPLGSWQPTVATLWPSDLVVRLLEWYDRTRLHPSLCADDEIIGRFLYAEGIPPLASVPSLVEHPDTEPSVMNGHRRVGDGRDPSRRAHFFIGDDPLYGCDATAIDWTGAASP